MRPRAHYRQEISNIGKRSVQTLIDNLIQKDEIFNRKTPKGFDSLYTRSSDKPTSVLNVDKPVNVETPKKNMYVCMYVTFIYSRCLQIYIFQNK